MVLKNQGLQGSKSLGSKLKKVNILVYNNKLADG